MEDKPLLLLCALIGSHKFEDALFFKAEGVTEMSYSNGKCGHD
jgi:hypothetical protein